MMHPEYKTQGEVIGGIIEDNRKKALSHASWKCSINSAYYLLLLMPFIWTFLAIGSSTWFVSN